MNINRPWSSVVGVHSSYQGLETSSRDQGLLSWMHTHTAKKTTLASKNLLWARQA